MMTARDRAFTITASLAGSIGAVLWAFVGRLLPALVCVACAAVTCAALWRDDRTPRP
jgi:hypothetical protein